MLYSHVSYKYKLYKYKLYKYKSNTNYTNVILEPIRAKLELPWSVGFTLGACYTNPLPLLILLALFDMPNSNRIDIFRNLLIDIDIFQNLLIDIDIDIDISLILLIDIDIFQNHHIDIDIDIDIF